MIAEVRRWQRCAMANITGNGALEMLSQGNCHLLHLGCHQPPQLHRPDMISLEQWQGCLQTVKRPILDHEIKGGKKEERKFHLSCFFLPLGVCQDSPGSLENKKSQIKLLEDSTSSVIFT